MVESNLQTNLFRTGMTREQLIDEYTAQIQSSEASQSGSVFSNESVPLIGEIFDYLDKDKNNTLDETEINDLINADTEDGGENVLNESDLTTIYDKIIQEESQTVKDPKEMYDKALSEGQNPDDYLKDIAHKVTFIDELITSRKLSAKSKIDRYQKQIDDLVARSTSLDTDFKQEYGNISNEITSLDKELTQKNDEMQAKQEAIEEKQREISCIKAEIESLDPNDETSAVQKQSEISALSAEISVLQSECTEIEKDVSSLSSKIQKKQSERSNMNEKAKSEDVDLKRQITTLEDKISKEKEDLNNDLSNYETTRSTYSSAQEYALSQIVSTSGNNDYDDPNLVLSGNAEELKSKWSKLAPNLSNSFYQKVMDISSNLNCDADVLMALMRSECSLDPTAVNKSSGATGLIQFIPSTAKSLGTSTQELKNMSAVQQLDYVEKYLANAKRGAGLSQSDKLDAGTLYTLVFLPAYAKRDVLAVSGDKYYNANSGLDTDKNGQITKADLGRRLTKLIPS